MALLQRISKVITSEMAPHSVRYSVCVSNYNMGDTIKQSITSFLAGLDDQFEVIIVDDGSSDNSREVIQRLAEEDRRIKYVFLDRSVFRLLGKTRNESIRHASGEYIILHVDADDVWEPFVRDFLNVYHAIEEARGTKFYLQGQQIGVGPRDLLLEHGPYRNTWCEDRDMWRRFLNDGIFMALNHEVFRTRLALKMKKKVLKTIFITTFQYLLFDLRKDRLPWRYFIYCLAKALPFVSSPRSKPHEMLRFIFFIPTYLISLFTPKLGYGKNVRRHEEYAKLLLENTFTCREIFQALGIKESAVSFSSLKAKKVFLLD